MDTQDTVTGQCDHIVGLFLADYPQHGESDRLARQSEGLDVDEIFNYCPSCGVNLKVRGTLIAANSEPYASSIESNTSLRS